MTRPANPIQEGRSDVLRIADGSSCPRSPMTTLHRRLNVTRLTPVEDAPSSQDARGTFETIDKAPGGVASMRRTMALAPLCLRARLVAATAVAVLASSQLASAQLESRISGVVRDATAAGIPGVTVTATNLTTKESRISHVRLGSRPGWISSLIAATTTSRRSRSCDDHEVYRFFFVIVVVFVPLRDGCRGRFGSAHSLCSLAL